MTTYELDFANFLLHLGPSSSAASATPVYVLWIVSEFMIYVIRKHFENRTRFITETAEFTVSPRRTRSKWFVLHKFLVVVYMLASIFKKNKNH